MFNISIVLLYYTPQSKVKEKLISKNADSFFPVEPLQV